MQDEVSEQFARRLVVHCQFHAFHHPAQGGEYIIHPTVVVLVAHHPALHVAAVGDTGGHFGAVQRVVFRQIAGEVGERIRHHGEAPMRVVIGDTRLHHITPIADCGVDAGHDGLAVFVAMPVPACLFFTFILASPSIHEQHRALAELVGVFLVSQGNAMMEARRPVGDNVIAEPVEHLGDFSEVFFGRQARAHKLDPAMIGRAVDRRITVHTPLGVLVSAAGGVSTIGSKARPAHLLNKRFTDVVAPSRIDAGIAETNFQFAAQNKIHLPLSFLQQQLRFKGSRQKAQVFVYTCSLWSLCEFNRQLTQL